MRVTVPVLAVLLLPFFCAIPLIKENIFFFFFFYVYLSSDSKDIR